MEWMIIDYITLLLFNRHVKNLYAVFCTYNSIPELCCNIFNYMNTFIDLYEILHINNHKKYAYSLYSHSSLQFYKVMVVQSA